MADPSTAAVPSDPPSFRFADIIVDTHARTVSRSGEPVPLEPKAFAVLLALLRRPRELVTRDELLDEVWGHRHVTPGVLTRAIAQLRHGLGDDPHAPRFIRTRHALGYCFIATMQGHRAADGPARKPPAAGAAVAVAPPGQERRALRAVRVERRAGSAGRAERRASLMARAERRGVASPPMPDGPESASVPGPDTGRRMYRKPPSVPVRWWMPELLAAIAGGLGWLSWALWTAAG